MQIALYKQTKVMLQAAAANPTTIWDDAEDEEEDMVRFRIE